MTDDLTHCHLILSCSSVNLYQDKTVVLFLGGLDECQHVLQWDISLHGVGRCEEIAAAASCLDQLSALGLDILRLPVWQSPLGAQSSVKPTFPTFFERFPLGFVRGMKSGSFPPFTILSRRQLATQRSK